MRALIHLAVCIVMAASSTATFAEGSGATSSDDDQQGVSEQGTLTSTSATPASDDMKDAEIGAASGEPARSDALAKMGARGREEAAVSENDQQLRQSEVWTSP